MYITRNIFLAVALAATLLLKAANISQSVTQVTGASVIAVAADYHITSATPFSAAGSIDIRNSDAVLMLDAVKPSVVKSDYLSHIFINGAAAQNDVNVRVGIYGNGTIVYPHTHHTYLPLTVYAEKNYGGEGDSSWQQTKYYNGLGSFDNRIRSFKLKRGYMVTLACNSDGTGYSRCFIAQDSDVNVPDVGVLLAGRTSFLRIFPWNKVTKKGLGGTKTYNHLLNATWSWNWGASDVEYDDEEYVPSHEQENSPSFSTIMALNKSDHLLGHCEPDNKVGENITVDQIENVLFKTGSWQRMYKTGMRVGSPAPGGGATSDAVWLTEFMRCCAQYNCRIDFVATHKYWYATGSQYNTQMNQFYNNWHRPLWITEWNYGGNWTEETTWPDADRSGTVANYAHELAGIKSIVTALEANPYVERYAIYNWVQDCRKIYNDKDSTLKDKNYLTPAGEWYAQLKSNAAFSPKAEYIPTWNYNIPTDLALTFNRISHSVTVGWKHPNGKQSDSIYLERKIDGVDPDYVVIARYGMSAVDSFTFASDTLSDAINGLVYYRVHDFDSDGKNRYSQVQSLMLGVSAGCPDVQYGRLKIANTGNVYVNLAYPLEVVPSVFMGMPTNKNTSLGIGNVGSTVLKNRFVYNMLPWQYQSAGITTVSNVEDMDYLVMAPGNYHYGKMDVEVGTAKAKGDTTEVTFIQPFPADVVPVVLTELRPIRKDYPTILRIWDVCNTGFKATALFEKGAGSAVASRNTVSYLAVTPGSESVNDTILLSAGIGDTPLCFDYTRKEYFTMTDSLGGIDTLQLVDPCIFASLQTYHYAAAASLRYASLIQTTSAADAAATVNGVRVRRFVDDKSGVSNVPGSADTFGWVTLSRKMSAHTVGIETVTEQKAAALDGVYDVNGRCIAHGGLSAEGFRSLPDGFYIRVVNGKASKCIKSNR